MNAMTEFGANQSDAERAMLASQWPGMDRCQHYYSVVSTTNYMNWDLQQLALILMDRCVGDKSSIVAYQGHMKASRRRVPTFQCLLSRHQLTFADQCRARCQRLVAAGHPGTLHRSPQ